MRAGHTMQDTTCRQNIKEVTFTTIAQGRINSIMIFQKNKKKNKKIIYDGLFRQLKTI